MWSSVYFGWIFIRFDGFWGFFFVGRKTWVGCMRICRMEGGKCIFGWESTLGEESLLERKAMGCYTEFDSLAIS